MRHPLTQSGSAQLKEGLRDAYVHVCFCVCVSLEGGCACAFDQAFSTTGRTFAVSHWWAGACPSAPEGTAVYV